MTPRQSGVLAGVTTWLLGFAAQLAWWSTGQWRAGRYGLLNYRAAVLGDGIFVPVVMGLLVAFVAGRSCPERAGERTAALVAGAVGALAGAAVQASWLLDPSPVTNWTLPRAHHFSFPGWYHACYLVVASGVVAALGTTAARRVRVAPAGARRGVAMMRGVPVLWMCGLAFVAVLALDSSGSSGTSASQATLVAAGGCIVAGAVLLRYAFGPAATASLIRRLAVATIVAILIAIITTLIGSFA